MSETVAAMDTDDVGAQASQAPVPTGPATAHGIVALHPHVAAAGTVTGFSIAVAVDHRVLVWTPDTADGRYRMLHSAQPICIIIIDTICLQRAHSAARCRWIWR